jgi:hypothetical protein
METVKSDAGCPELYAGFCTANGATRPSGVDLGGIDAVLTRSMENVIPQDTREESMAVWVAVVSVWKGKR